MISGGESGIEGRNGSVSARVLAWATACVCGGVTLLLLIGPHPDPTIGSRRFHVAIETAAAMVLIFVAAVLLGRFRLNGSRRTLLKVAAVLVLALDNLFSAVLTTAVAEIALAESGFATWASAGNGLAGAALLAAAASIPDRLIRRRGPALVSAAAGGVLLLALIVGSTALLSGVLPEAFPAPFEPHELELLSEHPALIVVGAVTAVCYGIAAVFFARLAEENRDVFLKWLSVGAVIAAVSFVNYALFPSQLTELVYTGDLLFLAAIGVLLYAAIREFSNEEAARVRLAVLEERRRVARDLHDGVVQELAFIASQTHWLIRQPEDREPLAHIMESAERALDESRAAIAALSRPIDERLDLALGHAAIDVANRVGARLELDIDADVDVPPDWRDALLRIAREAVANAVRHGRAGTISLWLHERDGVLLRVSDDGDGFDVDAPRSSQSFGLVSMRERAESLGGEFRISSERGVGTTIEVVLP